MMFFHKSGILISALVLASGSSFAQTFLDVGDAERPTVHSVDVPLVYSPYYPAGLSLSKESGRYLIVENTEGWSSPKQLRTFFLRDVNRGEEILFKDYLDSFSGKSFALSGDGQRIVTITNDYDPVEDIANDLSLTVYEPSQNSFTKKYKWSLPDTLAVPYNQNNLLIEVEDINHDGSKILLSYRNWLQNIHEKHLVSADFQQGVLNKIALDNNFNAMAISGDGRVLAGSWRHDTLNNTAVLQVGENYEQSVHLTNAGISSEANTLSYDGKVVGGYTVVSQETPFGMTSRVQRPTVWYGDDWKLSKFLQSTPESPEDIRDAQVSFLSADGRIAVVNATSFFDFSSSAGRFPEIWYGQNFDKYFRLIDSPDYLTAFRVTGMNADGTVLSGVRYNLGAESQHPVLWKVTYPKEQAPPPTEQVPPADQPSSPGEDNPKDVPVAEEKPVEPPVHDTVNPPKVTLIDVNLTRKSFTKQGEDGMRVLQMHIDDLKRLQQGCLVSQVGESCFSVYTGLTSTGKLHQPHVGFSIARGFSPNFSAGIVLDYGMRGSLPRTYRTGNSLGVGLYAQWQSNGWSFRPSISMNHYSIDIRRDTLGLTEVATGNSSLKGFGASAILGRQIQLNNQGSIELYGGVRHTMVNRKAYVEKDVAFPVSYGKLKMKDTALVAGLKVSVPVSDKLSLRMTTEVEQSIQHKAPSFVAREQYIGEWKYTPKLKKSRPYISIGMEYKVSPMKVIQVNSYYGRSIMGNSSKGVMLSFTARF
ncbi:autotransporter outer membrane beta-barrel domain-containing protein [Pelistega suis]|uniref:Autotransporter domain-containing protein n=1 Tax=Pelistega suis TaxID=1631957 RepID=A0A849P3W4_9BURK|nr:autotransporter domain-containing protein [Pelistega suis]NOL50743.1 autotransporter domain-containing protein [Pelistega suis]